MADQRPFGRFRLPWLSAVTAPQPQPQPQTTRPVEILAPAQPQRPPPFRPAGIAQVQPPAPPQPPSPPRAATESQINPQPASPSRTRAASMPPSPSRATTQAKAASLPPSPYRGISEAPAVSQARSPSRAAPQPRAASVPPLPTRTTTQPQPKLQTIAQTQSSARSTSQLSNQISSPSSPPKRVAQLPPTVNSQPSQFPPPPSQQGEPKPAEEKKNGPAKDLPAQTKADRKKTTTASSSGEQIKTASSTHPKLRNKSTESHKNPGMSNGEQVPLQKEIKDDITKFVHKLATGQLKYPTDDKPVSIVTITGENRGASMHVSSEPVRKEGSVHIHRGYKLNPDDSTGTTTDAEENRKGKQPKDPKREEKNAFLNSNAQSLNNSMVLESSVNEGSPGIHLVLYQNIAEPIKSEPLETHKAEVRVTPAQKLTYDPTIRRRCLRGLFLESSDSDPDNPEKPRRHGCRYNCGMMSKDKNMAFSELS
ncbi:vegetative cell wall protein gp1 [Euphorbia lathyris]|uniref:vegetative cell wall protein gp1 n=1 Tax=Euphorbia lathyris TaxID=212925 RepID=UPI003313C490